MRNIVLIGFMGSGKSTVGRRLARSLGWTLVDSDDYIVEHEGCAITDIFRDKGEAYFRNLETTCLKEILAKYPEKLILACGGGVPIAEENRKLLRKIGTVFYLRAKPGTLENRLKGDTSRPLLAGGDLRNRIDTLLKQRGKIYLDAADIIIDTDDKQLGDVINEITKKGRQPM